MPNDPAELQAAGFAADTAEKLTHGVKSGLLDGMHALLVARNTTLVLETYVPGADHAWGRPLGVVDHGADSLHDLRSVTKSVTSLVYAIALARGLVPPPEAPLLASFPEFADLAKDPARANWTVAHALDMTLGITWNEDLPYTDPRNSEIAMEMAPDRYRFILEQPIQHPAGSKWIYSGGASALVGGLVARGTGKPIDVFAQEALFAPLGITRFEWHRGRDGIPSAASGLRLTARDLMKIGHLLLAKGTHDGKPVVPPAWIEHLLAPKVQTGDGRMYGRQWYNSPFYVPAANEVRPLTLAIGNGGQRLWIMPSLGLVGVHFAGNYDRFDQWMLPTQAFKLSVLANLRRI